MVLLTRFFSPAAAQILLSNLICVNMSAILSAYACVPMYVCVYVLGRFVSAIVQLSQLI